MTDMWNRCLPVSIVVDIYGSTGIFDIIRGLAAAAWGGSTLLTRLKAVWERLLVLLAEWLTGWLDG